jgi:hypothetical protein
MKKRMVKLNPEFLMETLQGKPSAFISNLPDKIELLGIKYDLFSNQVSVIIRSDSFEDVAESDQIPEFKVIYATRAKAETRPTANFRPESDHIERTPAQKSYDAGAMEKEFSPEQRKLLTFKVDGENLLVKANQYLKEDWNEINDVVKSLGGKWEKTGGYWIIPLRES